MTVAKYSEIVQQIVYDVGQSNRHSQLFNTLKESFRDEINSPRRYEQISKIGQLLKILEIRDALSEDNVEPLKLIARKLNSDEILSAIADYEASHVKRVSANYYALQHTDPSNEEKFKPHVGLSNSNPYAFMSERKKKRMYDMLKERIGIYWRDLGRNLDIQEYVIEQIDRGNLSLYEKASKLLRAYDREKNPEKWFFNLCKALDKSRRKDLSKNLHEIMMMNL